MHSFHQVCLNHRYNDTMPRSISLTTLLTHSVISSKHILRCTQVMIRASADTTAATMLCVTDTDSTRSTIPMPTRLHIVSPQLSFTGVMTANPVTRTTALLIHNHLPAPTRR